MAVLRLKWTTRTKKGKYIPYGWEVSKYDQKLLVPRDDVLEKLYDAYKYWKSGDYSHRKLAEWLNSMFSESHRPVHYNGLLFILRRTFAKDLKRYRVKPETASTDAETKCA
jgi:hypothetical protein